MNRQEMVELADLISKSVVNALKESGLVGKTETVVQKKKEMSAYQKTEALLFAYVNFKKIIFEKQEEMAEIRKYGVPSKSSMSGGERVKSSRNTQGLMTFDESVEIAIANIESSFEEVDKAINMVDSALSKIKNEPYYNIIPLFYFNGCTLEDIGIQFGCDHSTISRNKSKLVKSLSAWLFPNDTVKEYFS